MMAVIHIDTDALETARSTYVSQAEAVQQAITSLVAANGELQECWQCETANAFYERFADEYKPALDKASEALESIATYLNNYSAARMAEDMQGAASI
ncbi:MAG: WXG100 family type VII secretion target [Clostridiales bacterium]|nr:WXG100 family type VII secretion target [Clostridiales bacterium]